MLQLHISSGVALNFILQQPCASGLVSFRHKTHSVVCRNVNCKHVIMLTGQVSPAFITFSPVFGLGQKGNISIADTSTFNTPASCLLVIASTCCTMGWLLHFGENQPLVATEDDAIRVIRMNRNSKVAGS